MIYVSDPKLFARRMSRRSRSLGDVFAGSANSCIEADGVTIDPACVAKQSNQEAVDLINYQDGINAQAYTICESNLALNNAQRQANGQALLPDTCAGQDPANANVTVYDGYENLQSGSGSPAGGTYYGQGTTPVVTYNPVANYPLAVSTPPSVTAAAPVLNITSGSNPPKALTSSGAPFSASGGSAAGGGISSVFSSGGAFDLSDVPEWTWIAGGAALLAVFFFGGRH